MCRQQELMALNEAFSSDKDYLYIEKVILEYFDVNILDLYSKTRKRNTNVVPRYFMWFFNHFATKYANSSLARRSGFDHATIGHAINIIIAFLIAGDKDIKTHYFKLKEILKEKFDVKKIEEDVAEAIFNAEVKSRLRSSGNGK